LLDQLFKERQTLANHFIADASAQPEVLGATEIIAGDNQQILLLGQIGELLGSAKGSLYEEIESTVGEDTRIAIGGQPVVQSLAIEVVCAQVGLDSCTHADYLLLQGGSTDVTHHTGSTCGSKQDAITIFHAVGNAEVTDTLTGQGEGLGVGVKD